MEKNFRLNKMIGIFLVIGSSLLLIPYTILSITFEYPKILRQDPSIILTKFYEGGSELIFLWWSFSMVGLPLLFAFSLIGKKFTQYPLVTVATNIGIIGLITQMIGLLRWTFIVPILSQTYITGDSIQKEISIQNFRVIHQLGGVILGEHIGQIFTIIWTIIICYHLHSNSYIDKKMMILGYLASFIYIFAQLELIATIIPNFPVIKFAGFIGSTLWLVWMILIGIIFIKKKENL